MIRSRMASERVVHSHCRCVPDSSSISSWRSVSIVQILTSNRNGADAGAVPFDLFVLRLQPTAKVASVTPIFVAAILVESSSRPAMLSHIV